jgi:hypothetical protein
MKKAMIDMKRGTLLETFFFQKETKKIYFTTLIQLPMAQLLIIFSKHFFDTVALLPSSNWSKNHQKTPFVLYLQFLVLQF